MIEWSIPFDDIHAAPIEAGSTIRLTISATGGTAVDLFAEHDSEDSYAVTLGDMGYGVNLKQAHNPVTYLISDETVAKAGNGSAPDPVPDPTPAHGDPDQEAGHNGRTPASDPSDRTAAQDPNGQTSEDGTHSAAAPRTGDPAAIMAAVAAVSAAGAFAVGRRRRR